MQEREKGGYHSMRNGNAVWAVSLPGRKGMKIINNSQDPVMRVFHRENKQEFSVVQTVPTAIREKLRFNMLGCVPTSLP